MVIQKQHRGYVRSITFAATVRRQYIGRLSLQRTARSAGQYNLGFLLRDDPDPRNQRRARYWLKRAAEGGDETAAQLLKEISGK